MRLVEPVSSWFRTLAMERMDPKSMKAYAHTVLLLISFLLKRQEDLRSATEYDIRDFESWRRKDGRHTIGDSTWDLGGDRAAAIASASSTSIWCR